jgi:hypothetical protein
MSEDCASDRTSVGRTRIGNLPTELLQEIFSPLDIWTLLKCRCVCRRWNDCIPDDSTELLALMFIPSANTKAVEVPDLKLTFLAHCYIIKLDGELITRVDGLSFDSWTGGGRVALNPFVTDIGRYLHITNMPSKILPALYQSTEFSPASKSLNKLNSASPYIIHQILISSSKITTRLQICKAASVYMDSVGL